MTPRCKCRWPLFWEEETEGQEVDNDPLYPNTHSEPQHLVDFPELEDCPHSESLASVTGLC